MPVEAQTKGSLEVIAQIKADLEALAEKWNLEFQYRRSVGGLTVMNLGVIIAPLPVDGPFVVNPDGVEP